MLRKHTAGVVDVALTRDGKLAVSGSLDHKACLWDTATGECKAVMEGHDKAVLSVAVSASGAVACSVGNEGATRVWALPAGTCK